MDVTFQPIRLEPEPVATDTVSTYTVLASRSSSGHLPSEEPQPINRRTLLPSVVGTTVRNTPSGRGRNP